MKEKSILEQLQAPEFKASKSDRILMEYIRANVENVPHTAIAHLAADSGVGEATITRFVKKMGFPNLSGFKLALARELTESSHRYIINNNIEAGESALETGRKLLDVNIGTLEKTLESLSDGVIERCAALMCAAKRLQFIGLGNSGFIAQDSAYKFYRIGLESFGLDDHGGTGSPRRRSRSGIPFGTLPGGAQGGTAGEGKWRDDHCHHSESDVSAL